MNLLSALLCLVAGTVIISCGEKQVHRDALHRSGALHLDTIPIDFNWSMWQSSTDSATAAKSHYRRTGIPPFYESPIVPIDRIEQPRPGELTIIDRRYRDVASMDHRDPRTDSSALYLVPNIWKADAVRELFGICEITMCFLIENLSYSIGLRADGTVRMISHPRHEHRDLQTGHIDENTVANLFRLTSTMDVFRLYNAYPDTYISTDSYFDSGVIMLILIATRGRQKLISSHPYRGSIQMWALYELLQAIQKDVEWDSPSGTGGTK